MLELTVMSAAFVMGAAIPPKYAYTGDNISPPLSWSDVPENTVSIAIICDDPDAPIGDWVHWVIFNIPADKEGLAEGIPKDKELADGSIQGINDYRQHGYDGPGPPPGRPHRYAFRVYALDTRLSLDSRARKKDVLAAIKGHVLAKGVLMGTFQR